MTKEKRNEQNEVTKRFVIDNRMGNNLQITRASEESKKWKEEKQLAEEIIMKNLPNLSRGSCIDSKGTNTA